MTTATASPSTALVSFRDRIKQNLNVAKQSVEAAGGQMIRLKEKKFVLPDGTQHAGPLACVVLDFASSHSYFPGVYNPKKPTGPVCWAKGKIIAEMTPSANAPEKQSVTCGECRLNQFGSGMGNAKACKQSYQLAIVPPTGNPNAQISFVNVSPASRKAWGQYIADLAERQLSPVEVITNVSFDPESTYGALLFDMVGPNEHVDNCARLYYDANQMLLREPKKRDD